MLRPDFYFWNNGCYKFQSGAMCGKHTIEMFDLKILATSNNRDLYYNSFISQYNYSDKVSDIKVTECGIEIIIIHL